MRAMEEPFGKLNPTLETSGEGFNQLSGAIRKTHRGQELMDPMGEGSSPQAVEMSLVAKVLHDGQFLIQAGGLKDDADTPSNPMRLPDDIQIEDLSPASCRKQEGREDLEDGGFPPTVGAQESKNLTTGYRKGYPCKGLSVTVNVPEVFHLDSGPVRF